MCGCNKGGNNASVNSTNCGGRTADLHKVRNDLITLTKITTDQQKKDEYNAVIVQVEELIKNSVESCPSIQIVNDLKQYVKDEFASYNN